jgi:hypothetical protein
MRFLLGVAAFAFLTAFGVPQAHSQDPLENGYPAKNFARAAAMTFNVGRDAMGYLSDPSKNSYADTDNLPDGAIVRLLRIDGTTAVVRVIDGADEGDVVWIDPNSITDSTGWTLSQVLRGIDLARAQLPDGSMAGGPFFLFGTSIIGCRQSGAVEALSQPNARAIIGQDNFMVIFEQYGCSDLPQGLRVSVRAASPSVALIFPEPPDGNFFLVLRQDVVDQQGQPIPEFFAKQ